MDRLTHDLLYTVPVDADYAVDATDLDPEDIPQSRVDDVMNLLSHSTNSEERFLAARLLTSWGYYEGLIALEKFMNEYKEIEGFFSHRLHGYDDTCRHILLAITRYFACMADCGNKESARAQVYAPLSKIISLANTMPFEIASVFDFISRRDYPEYIPLIKQHLVSIIDHPETHHWKIHDAVKFLLQSDADFVLSLLNQKDKKIEDYKI